MPDERGSAHPKPGDRVGRYQLERLLGRGAVTQVFRAAEAGSDRVVALQFIRDQTWWTMDEERHAWFRRRVLACAAVRHNHLLGVHDHGRSGRWAYVVMDEVDGMPLDECLTLAPWDWRRLVRTFHAVARGLHHAHGAGLLHSALDLRQVIIRHHEGPVLKGLWRGRPPRNSDDECFGPAAGTSPERIEGRSYDHRSDQFGLCALLWRALFGEWPFEGSFVMDVFQKILRGEPPAPPSTRTVPAAVVDLMMKGLASDPDHRWTNMGALADGLEAVVG